MQSSLISKIEKARRYVDEGDRVTMASFTARFRGDHNDYTVSYDEGKLRCTCDFFSVWGLCSHTMAVHKMMGGMLPKESMPLHAQAVG